MQYEKITYTLMGISNGAQGIRETLDIMSNLVVTYKSRQDMRELALYLTQDLPPKDYIGEIKRCHEFVRDHIRYVKDILEIETIQSPSQTVRQGAGDCDDKSTLVATLLACLGHSSRFVAIGFAPGKFSHVLVQTKIKSEWVYVECTENVPLGWHPNGIRAKMIKHNDRIR